MHRTIADAFVSKLVERTRAVVPKSPLDPTALCGPMIDEVNAQRVEAWVEEAPWPSATRTTTWAGPI